ncbi:molybdenum ABC transporter ATP-binding protein [Ensifer sp.]|jgi:molybdate transport system ATP-binding protein|uniref:molybdenum ABC transporter ATP-binding protein n=1 Tax=Ensifer sp. TaxID=1872086 RepID=UPI002E1407DF|nr:molybdenum ABC transporter ATP-binding protein [Ensifer sp.]
MSLTVEARHQLGDFSLDAAFTSDGGVTALFGRSGSGKTSLINIIAGLMKPQSGRVLLDGDVIADSERKIFTPVHRRRFGYVFQEARLFPHLSVHRNLAYGRWFAGKSGSGGDFARIVDMLGIGHLLERSPSALSGGEKQRVAIGRALLAAPRLLLMDEPLAALDEARKAEILPYLERLRDDAGIPIVYVSHSVGEVARLAKRVVVLENGQVTASGAAAEVLSAPAASIATGRREAGVVLEGIVQATDADHDLTTVRIGGETLRIANVEAPSGRTLRLHIAARDVMLATSRPQGISALNVLEGNILSLTNEDDGSVDVRIDCGGATIAARITRFSRDALALMPGKTVYAIIKSVAIDH